MSSHPVPDQALEGDIAILGKKGRGKTYTAKGLVERLLDGGHRVLVLDPLSTWWGLKSSADGEREGFPIVVFGGPKADVPILDTQGRALARVLASENIPAVVDLGEMRKAEQQRLAADLLDELFTLNRQPLTIVLEEADAFAPQSPMGDQVRVLSEVDRIARRGRAYGFRLISITQRPAKLNKDVLTQLSVLIALGVTSPQDRDALKSWVEGNADRERAKEVYNSLAKLPVGEGWVWAPDMDMLERVTFPQIRTLDTSATPRAGAKQLEPKVLAGRDVAALAQQIEIDSEARPDKKPARAAPVDKQQVERAHRRGHDEGYRKGYEAGLTAARQALEHLGATKSLPKVEKAPDAAEKGAQSHRKTKDEDSTATTGLGPERRPLATLVQTSPGGLTEAQWATLTGMKRTGGTWATYKSRLRTAGLIQQEADGLWRATEAGIAQLGEAPPAPRTLEERLEMWRKAVGAAAKLLDVLIAQYPAAIRRVDLAEEVSMSPTGGTFSTYLSRLSSNGLVVKQGKHSVRASDKLMKKEF